MPFSSPTPHESPAMAHQTLQKLDRPASSAPAPAPLSKRDKRRNNLSEKLTDLTNSFAQNRDAHYRSQLTALQLDMQLILHADPYKDAPLADMGEDVDELVSFATGGNTQPYSNGITSSQGANRWAETDAAALAGRWYMQFVDDVNNATEERDLSMALLDKMHQRRMAEFENLRQYKIRLAEEEHAVLCRTIKDRLVQSINERKKRLTKEKEQLDVADSNALLLHPNQFSITNPASPGGAHSNRKTRNTRHRPGEMDDISSALSGVENTNKRKRKLALDDDIGSPGPIGRLVENGTNSPYRDTRARLAASQFEAPLYSIDKLFTEKELLMHLHLAATAASHFFASTKANNGTAPAAEDTSTTANANLPTTGNAAIDPNSSLPIPPTDREETESLAAPEMDRTTSTSHHATRSTRNATAAAAAAAAATSTSSTGLAILGDLAVSEKNASSSTPAILPASAFAPIVLPSVITKTGQAPPPPSVSPEVAADDLAKILALSQSPGAFDMKIMADLMDESPLLGSGPGPGSESNATTNGFRPAVGQPSTLVSAAAVTVAGLGGVPMSAQSSLMGGEAMKRDESSMGAGPSLGLNNAGAASSVSASSSLMKRSASGAGFVSVDGGKRVRNR